MRGINIVRPGVEFIAENGEGPGEETGCIVPASGYYEWRPAEGGKKRYFTSAAFIAVVASENFVPLTRGQQGTTIAIATLVGVALNFASFNPIQALFWSAVINGVVAVPVMVLMMLLTANTRVMGQFTVTGALRFMGWLATGVMTAAVVGMLVTAGV